MQQQLNIVKPNESPRDLEKKQWQCLDSLAEHYKNASMNKISATSKFEDDEWDIAGSDIMNYKWAKWSKDEKFYPLLLVCKVACYHSVQTINRENSSTHRLIFSFLNKFTEMLQEKSILIAEREQPFNTLSLLTNEDILLTAQSSFAQKGTISSAPFGGLHYISTTPFTAFPNAEFLTQGIDTPWFESNLGYQSWTKKLKQSYGLDVTIKSYKPLTFETVGSIVQHATPFITEHFDTIVGVFDEIEKFHKTNPPQKKRRINISVGEIIQRKYGEKLDGILRFEHYESERYQGQITASWYSKLEMLTQGAAAWVILLTTGLRNVDMRKLEKGCCQPSKRHDLLNYLITDIQKTHLSDYILPVPNQTVRAVKLAELGKIDRKGTYLITKQSTRSSDNTTEDKRKMSEGSTFNGLIKNFTNHYGINLETISNDDSEATAHCVRATLAGYIGANSTAAILILKKLFGHSNALMPDAYLAHNPLVIAERNKNILNSQESLAEDMASGMVSGKLSGTKGKQMIAGAEHVKSELKTELANESHTEMDMSIKLKDRLKEMLLTRIQENQIYALKTPMSVACIRNCSDSSDTPCAKLPNREKRKNSGISKEITDALATLPNPAHCIGKECSDALFGEAWSRDLLGTFDYYIKYLKGVGYQSIDIKYEAELFVKNYGSILKDIYADEREEGYFD